MSLLEIAGIVMMVIFSGLMIALSISMACSFRHIKETGKKVKVRNRSSILYPIWIGISSFFIAMNILSIVTAIDQADTGMAKGHLYCTFVWVLSALMWLITCIFRRSSYVTPAGIMTVGGFRSTITPDSITYRMDGKALKIYRSKSRRPIVYTVGENMTGLTDILNESYKQYDPEDASGEIK